MVFEELGEWKIWYLGLRCMRLSCLVVEVFIIVKKWLKILGIRYYDGLELNWNLLCLIVLVCLLMWLFFFSMIMLWFFFVSSFVVVRLVILVLIIIIWFIGFVLVW